MATMLKKGGEVMGQHQPHSQNQQQHKLAVDSSIAAAGGAGRWREWMKGMMRVPPSSSPLPSSSSSTPSGGERRD